MASADKVSDKDLHSIHERIALLGGKAGDQSSTQAYPDRNTGPLSEMRCVY